MQAAPNTIGQVPYRPLYPQKENLHPSHQPLPQSKTRAGSGSLFAFLILSTAVLSALAVINLSFRAVNTENSYRLQRIKNEIVNERAEKERLELDIARLASPERIQKMAAQDLAMTAPQEISFLSMPNGKTSPRSFAYVSQKEER